MERKEIIRQIETCKKEPKLRYRLKRLTEGFTDLLFLTLFDNETSVGDHLDALEDHFEEIMLLSGWKATPPCRSLWKSYLQELPGILRKLKLDAKAIAELVRMKLGLVHLDGFENHLPSEISGGMKKRAGLARAMALNPRILFFDEPSAGLDPVTSAELDNLILHVNRSLGTTMVIVTHELPSIFAVAHRVIMLDKKSKGIIAEGDPGFLRENSQNRFVSQFFNRRAEA